VCCNTKSASALSDFSRHKLDLFFIHTVSPAGNYQNRLLGGFAFKYQGFGNLPDFAPNRCRRLG
jgi:hypothetical protein